MVKNNSLWYLVLMKSNYFTALPFSLIKPKKIDKGKASS